MYGGFKSIADQALHYLLRFDQAWVYQKVNVATEHYVLGLWYDHLNLFL